VLSSLMLRARGLQMQRLLPMKSVSCLAPAEVLV
jgi:hypothetical protein